MRAERKNWVEKVSGMKSGQKRMIKVDHPREAASCRVALGQYAVLHPELGHRFSISWDRKSMELTVEAVKR